jgi:protein SCO1
MENSLLSVPLNTKRAGIARLAAAASRLLLITLCLSSLIIPIQAAQVKRSASHKVQYVCVMDPEVKADKPGKCPKCGMFLRKAVQTPTKEAEAKSNEAAASGDSVKLAQIPDTLIYDQNGKRLHFYSDLVKGKTVAINFIFTTCTTICPPLTATFRKVQQEFGDRVGRDIHLISISVDPTVDVPDRLKAFSAKFNAGPGWTFVTGDKQEIDQLLKSLGINPGDKNSHSPMVLVGNDSAAYWTRTYGLAPAGTLVKVITDASTKSEAETATQVPLPNTSHSQMAMGEKRVEKRIPVEAAAKVEAGAKLGATPASAEVKRPRTPADAAAAYFPNTVLLTQDNKPVHFFDDLLKGKVVVINFMFTTCTSICPPMTANLAKVQEYLGNRVGKDINMISISVDPAVDTPEALKKYAGNYKVKPGWYFLTGKQEDVNQVLRKVGGFVEDKNDHTTLLMVGNIETGQWMKVFAMAKPAEIADAIMKIAESN